MWYHEKYYSCFTILSLSSILIELNSVTNEIINHRTNTTMALQIKYGKSNFLNSTTITLELLKFIQKTFVNLKNITILWYNQNIIV